MLKKVQGNIFSSQNTTGVSQEKGIAVISKATEVIMTNLKM